MQAPELVELMLKHLQTSNVQSKTHHVLSGRHYLIIGEHHASLEKDLRREGNTFSQLLIKLDKQCTSSMDLFVEGAWSFREEF